MNDKLKATALSDEDMEKVTGGTKMRELFVEWQQSGRQCSAAAFLARL